MEVEKRSSRGGFLNFFEWGGKSRKKLFSNHSDVPDGLRKGKENFENSSNSRYRLIEYDENRSVSSRKASSEYNYASSIASDEGGRNEIPGVVARLMGLDSMPTSNACEPCSSSFTDSCSEYIHREGKVNSQNYNMMDYQNMYYILEGFSTNPANSIPNKTKARPIEKFQSEMLPTKSAKTIPVTHHKLLSPIKSPGFIQTKNAAYIMEAASKIIESSPRASANGKMPSGGYSSVPFRIRDMKEKMEAAQKSARPQRPKENDAVKSVRGQMQQKNNGLYSRREDTTVKIYKDLGKVNSGNSKVKGRSVSLAEQAKSNVQRREGATSTGNRTSMSYKESNGVKSKQSIQGIQSTTEKGVQKRTSKRPSSVLQMNNQKQNNLVNKDNHGSRNMASNQQVRKSLSSNGSADNKKTVTKVAANSQFGPKKKGLMLAGTKEQSSSRVKNSPHNKRPVNRGNSLEGSFPDNVLIKKDGMSIQCNAVMDSCTNGAFSGRKEGMDIVSFTFSSPIKKPLSGSQFSGQGTENGDKSGAHSLYSHSQLFDSEFTQSSSLGMNAITGDGLRILLEQKLKELAGKIESSQGNLGEAQPAASSQSSLQDSMPFCDQGSTISIENDRSSQDGLLGNLDNEYDSDSSSINDMQLKRNQRWQGYDEVEEHSSVSGKSECSRELDPEQLTPSFCSEVYSNGSFYSSQSTKIYGVQVDNLCSLSGRDEAVNSISGEELCFQSPEWTVLQTAASSPSTDRDKKNTILEPRSSVSMSPTDWELKYVRDILGTVDLMVQDIILGRSDNVIPPHLFDVLENQEVSGGENFKVERKLLFDLVSELVNLRFKQFPIGHGEMLSKVARLSQSKGLLAENLYKEISTLRSMEDLMVDEIVDKGMSTGNGRWVDFDTEAIEEGEDLEHSILLSLIDELVADVFP